MLKKMEIRANANAASYQRGRDYYESGCVHQLSVNWGVQGDRPNVVSAVVKGSRGKQYATRLVIGPEETIDEYECSCPAAQSYYGMCKHCVAVALAYQEEERRRLGTSGFVGRGMLRDSDRRMQDVLARYREENRWTAETSAEPVELDFLFFRAWGHEMLLECRIGCGYKYVVKNLAKLVCDIEDHKEVRYGARLSFVHDISAFAPGSQVRCQLLREIVPLLIPGCREAAERTGDQYRSLLIPETFMDRFLDLYLGGTIHIQETDYPVVDADPAIHLRIRSDRGGLTVEGGRYQVYRGSHRAYIFTEETGFWRCSSAFEKNMLPLLSSLQMGRMFLSRKDYEGFCAYVLPSIEPFCEIDSGDIDLDSFTPPEPEFAVYFAMPSGNVIEAAACVNYDDRRYDLLQGEEARRNDSAWHDFGKEKELAGMIRRYFPHSSIPSESEDGVPTERTASRSAAGPAGKRRRGRPRKRPELIDGIPVRNLDDDDGSTRMPRRSRAGLDEYGLPVRDLDEDLMDEGIRKPSVTDESAGRGSALAGRGGTGAEGVLTGRGGTSAEGTSAEQLPAPSGEAAPEGAVRGLLRHYRGAEDGEGEVTDTDDEAEEETGVMMPSDLTGWYAAGEDEIYRLLDTGLAEIGQCASLFVDDSIRRLRIRHAPKVALGVSIRSGLLDFDVSIGEMDGDEIAGILDAYRIRKKYYRMKNGDFLPVEAESSIGTVAELAEGMMIPDRELGDGHFEAPLYRVMYAESILRGDRQAQVQRGEEYRRLIRGIRDASEEEEEIPKGLAAELRRYQREGFSWLSMLCRFGFGGILADDMGLGKTLQMIALLLSRGKSSLIVTPASLIYNWESEVHRFAPGLSVQIIAGTADERKQKIQESGQIQVNITSYDLLKRDIEQYQGRRYDCLAIDEAQYIKNAGTQAARAVKMVDAAHRFALTGTPIENRLSDLWSIFDYLMPGYFGSYRQFRTEIEAPIVQDQDEAAQERLQKMAAPFILRRRKEDVLKDLPDKLEENVFVPMTERQSQVYRAEAARFRQILAKKSRDEVERGQIEILAMLTKLRQICCAPELCFENYHGGSGKVDACMDLLQSAESGGHRVLVFSQFTSLLELLQAEWAKKSSVGSLYLSGRDSARKRQQMVKQFQEGNTPVFFISLKAGGTGLNLTAADIVIHCDPWWNAAAQNQATDRAHRIGQTRTVNVMKLVARGTIEEKILSLQEKKAALAAAVTESEGVQDYRLNRDELMELFES